MPIPDKSTRLSEASDSGGLRICLAASGGGHLRQLLDLAEAWGEHDHFFVTEDTALGRSVADQERVHFVPHVALGQAKLGSPLRMMAGAVRSFFRSAAIVWRERPDIIVSTGAGSVFFSVVWARALGARVVIIESLARFDRLSAFVRIARPFAHDKVVQSQALGSLWPGAQVFDPIRLVDGPRPQKEPLLFATVGATLPFDRMVNSVAELKAAGKIPEGVMIQTGVGGAHPDRLEVAETMTFDQMISTLRRADIAICHGGTGFLITALREGCRVIAMPRLFALGEHYDNHQEEITDALCTRGLIRVAKSTQDLERELSAIRNDPPVMATSDPQALIAFLKTIVQVESDRRKGRPR